VVGIGVLGVEAAGCWAVEGLLPAVVAALSGWALDGEFEAFLDGVEGVGAASFWFVGELRRGRSLDIGLSWSRKTKAKAARGSSKTSLRELRCERKTKTGPP